MGVSQLISNRDFSFQNSEEKIKLFDKNAFVKESDGSFQKLQSSLAKLKSAIELHTVLDDATDDAPFETTLTLH